MTAKSINLTPARARVLREIINGKSVHKEMYGKRSFGANPQGIGSSADITRIVAPLERANLIKLAYSHNGWRAAWVATDAGIDALAAHDKAGA